MKILKDRIDALGVDYGNIVLTGRVGMMFAESRKHYTGEMVDVYRPALLGLAVEVDGVPVAEIAAGSAELQEVDVVLDDIDRMPLYEMLAPPGTGAPHQGADFALSYREMSDLADASERFFDALIDQDEQAINDADWVKFSYSGAFKRCPCSRDEFDGISAEFKGSEYVRGMNVGDYYTWWRRSQAMMTDQDIVGDETRSKAFGMLDAWKDMDEERMVYWLNRNLKVHPRHRPAFGALIAEHLAPTGNELSAPRA